MSKRSTVRSGRRVISTSNANRRLPVLAPPLKLSPLRYRSILQDRRQFHPLRSARPVRTFSGLPAHLILKDRRFASVKSSRPNRFSFPSATKASIAFKAPRSVLICVRRRARKEVLFAQGRAGRQRMRPSRRTELSSIRC